MARSTSRSNHDRETGFRELIAQLNGVDQAVAIDAYRHLVAAHLVSSAGRAGLAALDDFYPEQGAFEATLTADGKYAYALDTAADMLEAEVALNTSLSPEHRASLQRILGTLVDAGTLPPPTGAATARAQSAGLSRSRARVKLPRSTTGVRAIPAERNVVHRFTLEIHEERESHRREGELVDRYRTHLDERGFESSRLEMALEKLHLYNDIYIHPPRNQLVEAKGDTRRESVRMAIGQLFDYLHLIGTDSAFGERPRAAILLPRHPGSSIEQLLASLDIALVWEDGEGVFRDSRSGGFT